MAKTQEELNDLKNEYESVANKLQDLTEEELKLVTGGGINFYLTYFITGPCGYTKVIKQNSNLCTECNICSYTNVKCQYR